MLRKRLIQIIFVGVVLFLSVSNTTGSTVVVRKCRSSTLIAKPLGHGTCVSHIHRGSLIITRPHRKVVITSPLLRKFVRIYPHRRKVVVVKKPFVRHIAVNLCPTITFTRPKCVVEQTHITVWITNSNGSQTSVRLTKSGPGFLGPRGEWYPSTPTNEQLRVIYGF